MKRGLGKKIKQFPLIAQKAFYKRSNIQLNTPLYTAFNKCKNAVANANFFKSRIPLLNLNMSRVFQKKLQNQKKYEHSREGVAGGPEVQKKI